MGDSTETFNNRILICDDNKSIHDDLLKILRPSRARTKAGAMRDIESQLFEDDEFEDVATVDSVMLDLEIDSAYSGKEALAMVNHAREQGRPYALVFMDVRMPPGPDGIMTIQQIWEILPSTEVVIVTAYSDYTWDEIVEKLGVNDKLLYLRKPFSSITVKQIALNLTNKWNEVARLRNHLQRLKDGMPIEEDDD